MLKNYTLLGLLVFLISCSQTRYLIDPVYGYNFNDRPKILVGVHNNGIIDLWYTNKTLDELLLCPAQVISLASIDARKYRDFFDLDLSDSLKMSILKSKSEADYLLLGSFRSDQSNHPDGLLGFSYVTTYDQSYRSSSFKPKSTYEFTLFDLNNQRIVLKLLTTTTSTTFSFPGGNDDGSEYWTHPNSPFLGFKNFNKAKRKIRKLCHC